MQDAELGLWPNHVVESSVDWEYDEFPCASWFVWEVTMRDGGSGVFGYSYVGPAGWEGSFSPVITQTAGLREWK